MTVQQLRAAYPDSLTYREVQALCASADPAERRRGEALKREAGGALRELAAWWARGEEEGEDG